MKNNGLVGLTLAHLLLLCCVVVMPDTLYFNLKCCTSARKCNSR